MIASYPGENAPGETRRLPRRLCRALVCAGVIALGASCAAPPQAIDPPDVIDYLPAGADLYFSVDAEGIEDLLPLFAGATAPPSGDAPGADAGFGLAMLDSDEFSAVTQRISRAYGSVYPVVGGEDRVHIIVKGDFPAGLVDLGLATDAAWRRRYVAVDGRRYSYFVNAADGLELYIHDNETLVLATAGVELLISSLARQRPWPLSIGPRARDDLALGLATLYLPRPDLGEIIRRLGLPVRVDFQEMLFSLYREGEGIFVEGRLVLATEQLARAFSAALRLVVLALFSDSDISPRQVMQTFTSELDANAVVFRGLPFPAALVTEFAAMGAAP